MLSKRAAGLSEHTLADYANGFKKLRAFLGADPPLRDITARELTAFFAHLRTTPTAPDGIAPRPARVLSKKSILNVHTALSSLWTWALREGYADAHAVRAVPRPKPEQRVIVPYSRDDVRAMLAACTRGRTYTRPGKAACANARRTGTRNRAMVLLLLDTGMRRAELCALRVRDLELDAQRVRVFGKGSKERMLPLGQRTARALWRYLTQRGGEGDDPLFVTPDGGELRGDAVRLLIRRIGDQAGVTPPATVHRFRHTFAVTYLRNGGDIYTLQAMLGHTSLEMVRHYLQIAQADVKAAHRRASPVDNWRL